jgi:hypothetical protein
MLLVIEIFILALAVMAFAPDTPLGKSLHAWMVEAPVRAAAKLTPAKIIIGTIVLVCLIGWTMSAPELVLMIGFGDLAAYLDIAVVAMLLTTIGRLRFVLEHTVRLSQNLSARVIAGLAGSRAGGRQARRQRSKLLPSADEDNPVGSLAFA